MNWLRPRAAAFWTFRVLLALTTMAAGNCSAAAESLFEIQVVDAENGWPVPLVELRTNHQQRFITDNAGVIAFDLPELMGQPTWFAVHGHGYSVPADGFGYRGVRLTPEPGQTETVKVHRQLPARRLGRLTGAGLFAESQRLGRHRDWKESGVLGCDSIQTALHNGRLFWFWGDTTVAHYPLGIFHMTGATTERQPFLNFQPPIQLSHQYFTNGEGRPRAVSKISGDGPTWISGTISLPDSRGRQRLVGTYAKIRPPLEEYEVGLCVWNETKQTFERHRVLWNKNTDDQPAPARPDGHPVLYKDRDGTNWLLFGDPFPRLKCKPTFESWNDPQTWQVLKPQPSVPVRQKADRGSPKGGHSASRIESVKPHRGSIAFHAFLNRWVAVFTQRHGQSSPLGEIWYAEADAPTGPWKDAVQVVTHDNYTFYNPLLHPELIAADTPFLLFEGTYTAQFANQPQPTPRYDYNQILYRLDLPVADRDRQPRSAAIR